MPSTQRSRPAANASRGPNGAVVASSLRYKCGSLGDSRDPCAQIDAAGRVDEPARPRSCRWIRWKHVKGLLAMVRCRTAALGGHLDECTRFGHLTTVDYNICLVRH